MLSAMEVPFPTQIPTADSDALRELFLGIDLPDLNGNSAYDVTYPDIGLHAEDRFDLGQPSYPSRTGGELQGIGTDLVPYFRDTVDATSAATSKPQSLLNDLILHFWDWELAAPQCTAVDHMQQNNSEIHGVYAEPSMGAQEIANSYPEGVDLYDHSMSESLLDPISISELDNQRQQPSPSVNCEMDQCAFPRLLSNADGAFRRTQLAASPQTSMSSRKNILYDDFEQLQVAFMPHQYLEGFTWQNLPRDQHEIASNDQNDHGVYAKTSGTLTHASDKRGHNSVPSPSARLQPDSLRKVKAGRIGKTKGVPEDMLLTLALNQLSEKRHRSGPPLRLKEMRNLGACIRCRLSKTKCTEGNPCEPCRESSERAKFEMHSASLRPCGFFDCIRERPSELNPLGDVNVEVARAALWSYKYLKSRRDEGEHISWSQFRRDMLTKDDLLVGVWCITDDSNKRRENHSTLFSSFEPPLAKSLSSLVSSFSEGDELLLTTQEADPRSVIKCLQTLRRWLFSYALGIVDRELSAHKLSSITTAHFVEFYFYVLVVLLSLVVTLPGFRKECTCAATGYSALDRLVFLLRCIAHHLILRIPRSSAWFRIKGNLERLMGTLGCYEHREELNDFWDTIEEKGLIIPRELM